MISLLHLFQKDAIVHMHDTGVYREHLPRVKELSFEFPDYPYTNIRLSLMNAVISASFIVPIPLKTAC